MMLTARGDVADRVVGLELGADDYLPKPFEPRELAARLAALLRRGRRRRGRADRCRHRDRLQGAAGRCGSKGRMRAPIWG